MQPGKINATIMKLANKNLYVSLITTFPGDNAVKRTAI